MPRLKPAGSASRLGGLRRVSWKGDDGGVRCKLGAVPEAQDVRDDLNAPLVRDMHVEVHVREPHGPHVACDPCASFVADPRKLSR